jgi:hypothetical protein
MAFTELTLRLLLLFFPGIVCFVIVEALAVHRERKTHEVLFFTYVYGMLSYLAYALISFLFGFRVYRIDGESGLWVGSISGSPAFFSSLTDSKVALDFWEIGWVAVCAAVLAFIVVYLNKIKGLHKFAHAIGATNRFGDPNVWSFALNAPDATWCVVRDLQNKLMFQGYVAAFSDVEDVAELVLTDVIVYNEETSEECYRAKRLYIGRKRDELTVEFQFPKEAQGDTDGGQTEQISCPERGSNKEGGCEPAEQQRSAPSETRRQLPAHWQWKLWRQWRKFREEWRELRDKVRRK